MNEEWIDVNDRMPDGTWAGLTLYLSEEVLIANSCSINIGHYNRRDGIWYVGEPGEREWIDKITHWMPLPQNPHSEKEGRRWGKSEKCKECGFYEKNKVNDDGDHIEGWGCCCPYGCKDYSQWVKKISRWD